MSEYVGLNCVTQTPTAILIWKRSIPEVQDIYFNYDNRGKFSKKINSVCLKDVVRLIPKSYLYIYGDDRKTA